MPTEHCPNCRTLRAMRVSTTRRTIPDKAGKAKTVLTRTFHCQTCQSFVRSEEEEEVKRAG
jgi:hypothetical protein